MASAKKRALPANPAGLTAKEVQGLFADLATDWDVVSSRYDELTRAPDLEFGEFLRWCMANWPTLSPELVIDFLAYWERDGHEAIPYAEAVSIFARLELAPDPKHPGQLEGSWERELLHRFAPFFAADFAPFRAVYREHLARGQWHPDACHAFWLVDWLQGEEISADEAQHLGRWCAEEHYGSFDSTPRADNRCLRALTRRAGLADSEDRSIGIALLGMEGWRAALQASIDGDPSWSFERVVDVLDPLPLAAAIPRLIEGDRSRDARAVQAYVDYLRERPEPAAEMVRLAAALAVEQPRPRLAELLCLEAARRLLDAGEPVPDEVDELLTLTVADRPALPLYRDVLVRLPRARRLALIERDLASRDSRGVALVGLTEDEVSADGALLKRALGHSRFNPVAVGLLGGRSAQVMSELLDRAVEPAARPRLETALLEAAGAHVQAGGAFDEAWSFYLILGSPQADAVSALYDCLPEPLRSDLLVEAARECRNPSEVLDLVERRGLREDAMDAFVIAYRSRVKSAYEPRLPGRLAALNIEAPPPDTFTPELERFRARAANEEGPKEVVYVCQLVPEKAGGAATSLTAFGGQPPVSTGARPRGCRHVMTIDLRDAPELGSRFPGARAASLFVPPEPELDDDWADSSFWQGWTEAEVAPGLARLAKRQRTLVVHRCSVPESMFDEEGDEKLRTALVRFPGYLLGGPITIQQDTASRDDTFVAQLSEDFDLLLGDAGLFYSYVSSAAWDCH